MMKCKCGCEQFEQNGNGIYEDGYLVEYTIYCVECDSKIMTCAYGSEFYEEDNVIFE